jgi:ubiquinone/menaquinone biosynthesis C-methylase UbiE
MPKACEKEDVKQYWNVASCGEAYLGATEDPYSAVRASRYVLIPDLPKYADFSSAAGKDVLEIGVGLGTDFVNWLRNRPRTLTGVDLTPRAIAHTRAHIVRSGLGAIPGVRLLEADAEALPFPDDSFDLVYSWGVLHHSPDTQTAINEVHRVLRKGGRACLMIYHAPSLVGMMLWMRYALMAGKPFRSLRDVYAKHLESPGTKAYSCREAKRLCSRFSSVLTRVELTHGDLLEGAVGQQHGGRFLALAKRLWPRWLLKILGRRLGCNLIIIAHK